MASANTGNGDGHWWWRVRVSSSVAFFPPVSSVDFGADVSHVKGIQNNQCLAIARQL